MARILDASRLISRLSTGTYTVTRRAAATYPNGIATPGSTSTLTIIAAVVPASGRDLERLPEGRRSTETRKVFTDTPIIVGAEGGANESDLIAIGGDNWEAQTCGTWPALTGYYEVLVQRPNTSSQP